MVRAMTGKGSSVMQILTKCYLRLCAGMIIHRNKESNQNLMLMAKTQMNLTKSSKMVLITRKMKP